MVTVRALWCRVDMIVIDALVIAVTMLEGRPEKNDRRIFLFTDGSTAVSEDVGDGDGVLTTLGCCYCFEGNEEEEHSV